MAQPSVDLAVSDAVALGIAGLFADPTHSGQLMDRLHRGGPVDAEQLIDAARFEQGHASPEGHAALHCLIGWARSRMRQRLTGGRPMTTAPERGGPLLQLRIDARGL